MKDINNMSTLAILWYVVLRHKVFLLITSNILTIIWTIVVHFQPAYQNFVK